MRDEEPIYRRNFTPPYGPWTAHNFSLGNHLFTIKDEVTGDEVKLRRVVQIVSDLCGRPIRELRVLDLACLEGMYGMEFGRQGARVCAIEGREVNIEKARFAARALSLGNVEFHLDDVRNLSEDQYGRFDVVLCLGILYHLNAPDAFEFLKKIFSVCQHLAVIDTHISLHPEQSFACNGKQYWGRTEWEHSPDASHEEKQKMLWASLDNPTSFYFTRPSLCGLLYDLGFTSIYECHIPQELRKPTDRITLVAVRGTAVNPVSCPQLPPEYARDMPEEPASGSVSRTSTPSPALRLARGLLPHRLKRWVKQALFEEATK